MADVFLSYAREDAAYARALAEVLVGYGWTVWWDRKIPAGKTYAEVIEQELQAARCVIVFWSRTSVESDWVKTEAAEASSRHVLIPVLIEDVKVPFEFRRIQAASLVGWVPRQRPPNIDDLLAPLKALLGVQSKPPPLPLPPGPRGPAPPPVAPPTRQLNLRMLMAGALVLAAVGVFVILAVRSQSATREVLATAGSDPAPRAQDPLPSSAKTEAADAPARAVDAAVAAPQVEQPVGTRTEPKALPAVTSRRRRSPAGLQPATAAVTEPDQPKRATLEELLQPATAQGNRTKPAGPIAAGPLSKAALVAGLNGVRPKVTACYHQFKVPGTAMVNVVIGEDGAVSSAVVTGKFADTPTGLCVERAVKTASFPPSDGFSTPYPFQLK